MKAIVLSGNYRGYINFLKESGVSKEDFEYACRREDILGVRKINFILYGRYWLNEIYDKAYGQIIICLRDDKHHLYLYENGEFFKQELNIDF